MRAFKTKVFVRWARHERLTDDMLRAALEEMRRGLMGVSLGGHIYKKRIALAGRGKRGGGRVLLVYRQSDITFFVRGFAKKDRDDIGDEELRALKDLADKLLNLGHGQLQGLVETGELIEMKNNGHDS